MIPANVEVSFDRQAVQKYLQQRLDEEAREVLWFVDIDKMVQLTCMSKRWLEDEVVSDVRMRAIEIRKNRKRWWPYRQAFAIIEEITSEW
ncbi:hypothetical protein ACOSZE_07110 [Lysinibacillus fusiformis]|uniref:hypothetical protein n=1 Tax=Lysinibacillus fusiformis TaxID=28031 RepID=UPI003B9E9455